MPIHTRKHCRETPEPEDGTRILTMRFWPRGVRRERFDAWMRELAPSAENDVFRRSIAVRHWRLKANAALARF